MSLTGNDFTAALTGDRSLSRRLNQLDSLYPERRAALIPALHAVQDKLGYLPDEAVVFIAERFETTPADVLGVISFYDMFHRKPRGEHEIVVCRNLACKVNGADEVVKSLEDRLGVRCGETTEDGKFSLGTFECLGGCTEAPLVAADWRYFANVDGEKANQIVDDLIAGTEAAQEPRAEEPDLPAPPKGKKHEIYLTRRMREAGKGKHGIVGLAEYEETGGYKALAKALKMGRKKLIDLVKDAGLRGRGGAGFSAGIKWSFMPERGDKPHYLAVNADESEPGTCKDRLLMERDPHSLIEGSAIAAFAIQAEMIYIYIRGEYLHSADVMEKAIADARKAGYLGEDVCGSGQSIDCVVHRGAGAYICGEETALMESLEGKRGHPRSKPPFPAQSGLWECPTTVNNVETLCNVPYIVDKGAAWYKKMGNEKSPGNLLYAVSGRVKRPGIYELPLGTTARYLIEECAGGMQDGYELVGFNPGGASSGFLPPEKLDITLDHDTLKAEQSMLGTGGITVVDQEFGMVRALETFVHFFEHETCGQCAPCREGCAWASKLVSRFLTGEAQMSDLDSLLALLESSVGRTICVYPEALSGPVRLGVEHFRAEFEKLVKPDNARTAVASSGSHH